MDAASDVETGQFRSSAVPGGQEQTPELLREEIKRTSKVLHDHVDELRDHVQHRIESLRNPFGLHDRIEESPLAACGVAFAVGLVVGVLRGRPHLWSVASRLGGSVGSSLAGHVTSRVVDRVVSSRPWV